MESKKVKIPGLKTCYVCPLNCGVNRYKTRGLCGADANIEVSSYNLHRGEETPISGQSGSGTIFFTHCSLGCIFCQNYTISKQGQGRIISEDELIKIMLELQDRGAHNINLVTPTHYALQILKVLKKIKDRKLKIPVVYNTSGYENIKTLRKLEGLVDVYLPDIKFFSDATAALYTQAKDYHKVNVRALEEMFRQVGNLKLNEQGIAERGLLIRHLVLPEGLSGTSEVLRFLREKFGKKIFLSLMSQYHPVGDARRDPKLCRRITRQEYFAALSEVERLGLENVYSQ
ncbi:MAG: radical SAM protein [Elusimicrobia bacterium]|nr:radical SAM protein [Elusimicrobiota bacterium]